MTTSAENFRWDDVLFEHRNREYGAYTLRKTYSRNLITGAGIMISIVAVIFVTPALARLLRGDDKIVAGLPDRTITLDIVPPIDRVVVPQERVPVSKPVKTLRYVAPRLTKETVDEQQMPTNDEVQKAVTSTLTQDGPETIDTYDEPVKVVVTEGEDISVHQWVEQQPEFPGGMRALMAFLGENLKYPRSAQIQNIEGKVFVQFIVNKDGSITDVAAIRGISGDCDREAARVVSLMPRWNAGKQNGKPVRVKYVLPINYVLSK